MIEQKIFQANRHLLAACPWGRAVGRPILFDRVAQRRDVARACDRICTHAHYLEAKSDWVLFVIYLSFNVEKILWATSFPLPIAPQSLA
jgi:hypothetical protein